MQAGPIRYKIMDRINPSIKRRVIIREASFIIPASASPQPPIQEVWNYLVEDENRISLIAHDIITCLKENRFSLILSERNEYLNEIKNRIKDKTPFCIFSAGSLSGEGFDLPVLDTLFLTMPIAFKGRVIQYAGRIHRKYNSKKEVRIYDYVDTSSGLTISMCKKRLSAYKTMGYEINTESNTLRAGSQLIYSLTKGKY